MSSLLRAAVPITNSSLTAANVAIVTSAEWDRKGMCMDKILIIEDSLLAQSLLSNILLSNYELVFENDGLSGLTAAQTIHPDLIILDIQMPGMNGYEVCRTLKGDDKTSEIPIIFITSLDSELERARGFEVGANDYVVKPFYKQELIARVRAHLSFRNAKMQALSLERLNLFQEMAVAISHEINNPLTTINAYLHVLQRDFPATSDPAKEIIAAIKVETDRITAITAKLAEATSTATTRYQRDITMIDLNSCSGKL